MSRISSSLSVLVRSHVNVPEHIKACAGAVRYDLLHGPSYCRIPAAGIEAFTSDDIATYPEDLELARGDELTATYDGKVGDTLREFISDLPADLWIDSDCDGVMTSEPESEEFEGETFDPNWESIWHIDGRDIVECLFGETIAREFH